jgi:preprotein translocase subunit YajC
MFAREAQAGFIIIERGDYEMSNKTKRTALRFSALAALSALSAVLLTGCVPTATGTGAEGGTSGGLMSFLPLIVIIAVFYFIMIRPQQKKTKQVNEMRSNVKPGDYVTTIGGFRGRVVRVKDDLVTIQVGSDKTKLDIMKWGISKIEESAPATERKQVKTIKSAKEREEELEAQQKKPKKLTKTVKKEEPEDEPETAELGEEETDDEE